MSNSLSAAPLVSIACVTYNHEDFIAQCLEGFLIQKTNFRFEILVHEDASTDRTAFIVREYEARYPQLFRCVYQTENQFKKQNTLVNILLPMARGKYMAHCEGDDYWTDPYKLQKQVDFLESNSAYVLCFHRNIQLRNGNLDPFSDPFFNRDRDSDELIWGGILLQTVMYRRNALDLTKLQGDFNKVMAADVYILILLSYHGKAKFLENITPSVYRFHEGGFWSPFSVREKMEKRIENYLLFDKVAYAYGKQLHFILMNFLMDLTIVNTRERRFLPAVKSYLRAGWFSLKSLQGIKWFILFHFRMRYKKYIVKKLSAVKKQNTRAFL